MQRRGWPAGEQAVALATDDWRPLFKLASSEPPRQTTVARGTKPVLSRMNNRLRWSLPPSPSATIAAAADDDAVDNDDRETLISCAARRARTRQKVVAGLSDRKRERQRYMAAEGCEKTSELESPNSGAQIER